MISVKDASVGFTLKTCRYISYVSFAFQLPQLVHPWLHTNVPVRITEKCLSSSYRGEKGKFIVWVLAVMHAWTAEFQNPLDQAWLWVVLWLCHYSSSVQTNKCSECWFGLFKMSKIGFYDAKIVRSTFNCS